MTHIENSKQKKKKIIISFLFFFVYEQIQLYEHTIKTTDTSDENESKEFFKIADTSMRLNASDGKTSDRIFVPTKWELKKKMKKIENKKKRRKNSINPESLKEPNVVCFNGEI